MVNFHKTWKVLETLQVQQEHKCKKIIPYSVKYFNTHTPAILLINCLFACYNIWHIIRVPE